MTNISPRTWVLFGFGISLISVVISVFVLTGINDKLKDTETELSKLTTSLTNQATEMARAEVIYGQFVMLNNISQTATGDAKKSSGEDSIYLLQAFLDRTLFAVNDIPTIDVLKETSERDVAALEYLTKLKKAKEAGNTAEVERIEKEAETMLAKFSKPTTELGKLIKRSADVADPEKLATMSTEDITNEISPYLKELNEQFIANYQKKETRIKELEKKKEDLTWWSSIVTYLAVALQLFGLMAVMSKDLASDSEARRAKAEQDAAKAEEEAKAAYAEMKEAVDDTHEAKEDMFEAREDAIDAREEADILERRAREARDLLAELEDDLESALGDSDKPKQ